MNCKICFKIVLLGLSVLQVELADFKIKPAATTFGYYSKSVSMIWELESVTVISGNWKDVITDESIVGFQSGTSPIIKDVYQGRVNVSITDRRFEMSFYNLQFYDEKEIKFTILAEGLVEYSSITKLEVITPLMNVTITPSGDITVGEGNPANFTCTAESRPISNITWYKGTAKLTNNGVYDIQEQVTPGNISRIESQLKLLNVQRTDSGTYRCKFHYPHTSEWKSRRLFVHYAATITSFPPELYGTVEGAQNVDIQCVVISNPASTINWYINDAIYNGNSPQLYTIKNQTRVDPITGDTRIVSIFHLINITTDSFAKYTCEASNIVVGKGVQNTSQSTTLVVSNKPYFLDRPPPTIVVFNSSLVILNCTVQGHPSPSVWWTTNNTKLDSTRVSNSSSIQSGTGKFIANAVLEISGIRPTDSGVFKCNAMSGNETVAAETLVRVTYSPTLYGLAPTTIVEENQLKFLQCQVLAFPPPIIKWFFAVNGLNYTEVTTKPMIEIHQSEDGYSSNISSRIMFAGKGISRFDSGIYKCQVTNTVAMVNKTSNVTVQFVPEVTFLGPRLVRANETAVFECVVDSNPEAEIKWFKDSIEIQPSSTETTVNNVSYVRKRGFFTIRTTIPSDMAVYKCEAQNSVVGVQKTVKKEIDFKVRFLPILVANSATMQVALTTELKLSCAANAFPAITHYHWYKNGQYMSINENALEFISVRPSTEGNYTCTPQNEEGNGSTIYYHVTVIVAPSIISSNCTTINNEQSLKCEVDAVGIPQPNITWTNVRTNQTISNESIMIIELNNNTDVNYTLYLMNTHGSLIRLYDISKIIPGNSEWSTWTNCDKNCAGQQRRSRRCFYRTCDRKLSETRTCNLQCPSASTSDDEWHKDWYIAFWVAIPLLLILLIILFVKCRKRQSSKKKAIYIPRERDIPPSDVVRVQGGIQNGDGLPKQMQTQREIYLPDRVKMTAVNNGYIPDQPPVAQPEQDSESEPEPEQEFEIQEAPTNQETDIIEVEMQFQDEPEEKRSSPPQRPKLDPVDYPVDAVVEVENEDNYNGGMRGISNQTYEDEEPDISFPASTFNHLNSPTGNASFMGLYDSPDGPPKPPRIQDTSFKDRNSAYGTASVF